MHMLDFKQGDKTALKAFIDKVTGLDSSKYTQDVYKRQVYKQALLSLLF